MNPRSTLAASLACLTVLTTSASSVRTYGGPAAGGAPGFVVATFNMGGGHPVYSHHAAAPDALAARIDGIERRRGPVAFVALQEACRDWVERLDRLLPGHIARFDPVLTTYRADIRCRNPIFGNAVLYRADLGIDVSPAGHRLDSPPPLEQREMLCVRSRARRLTLCTTHLSYNSVAIRRIEMATARRVLDTGYAGDTKIVGGDLNDVPRSSAFDGFYRPAYGRASRGGFTEAGGRCGGNVRERAAPDGGDEPPSGSFCRSGPATYGSGADAKKLDYLFVSPELRIRGAGTAGTPYSDHRLLWAHLSW